jgi:SAM-dependent methyltransferase
MEEALVTMEEALARIEVLVMGPGGKRVLELLYRIQRGCSPNRSDDAIADELVAIGLCEANPAGMRLTALGSKCADSAREYLFWTQRNRKLHDEDMYEVSKLANFRDRSVLEVGAGWGCNLVRFAAVAERVVGVEIEPVYIAFSRILAKLEGIEPPEIILGAGENLPFDPGEFDWVVLYSALQYMDVHCLLREGKRVLRPGGFMLTTQMLLGGFVSGRLKHAIRDQNARLLLSTASIAANTLWYQYFGRRLRDNFKENATARPIHPAKSFLIKSAERAGLRFRSDLSFRRGGLLWLVLQAPCSRGTFEENT